jgi:hypothetical protein
MTALLDEAQRHDLATIRRVCSFQIGKRGELPGYKLSNLAGNIRRHKQRLEEIAQRHARTEAATAAADGILIEGEDYVRIAARGH